MNNNDSEVKPETVEIELELLNLLLVENPQVANWTNGKALYFKNSVWKIFYKPRHSPQVEGEKEIRDPLPMHLRENASYLQCDCCGRKSYSGELFEPCNFPAPNDKTCQGYMQGIKSPLSSSMGEEKFEGFAKEANFGCIIPGTALVSQDLLDQERLKTLHKIEEIVGLKKENETMRNGILAIQNTLNKESAENVELKLEVNELSRNCPRLLDELKAYEARELNHHTKIEEQRIEIQRLKEKYESK